MIGDTYEKSLPCKLTDEELRALGLDLARLMQKAEEVEMERKLANQGFKERAEEIAAKMRRISRSLGEGREWRMVEVCELLDRESMKVCTVRGDTGATISRRDPTPEERQHQLFPKPEKEEVEPEGDPG